MHSPSKPELHEFFDDVKTFIKSENFHKLIVALVIVDCLCVASELLLLEISKYVMQNGQQKVLCMAKTLNTTHHFLNKSSELNQHKNDSHHGSSPELHLFFEISEDILKYISTSILGLFCIELVVKLMLIPQIFVKSKWEILDGFVVFVSFSLNIFLIVLGDTMESVTGLLVLLRLSFIEFLRV